MAFPWGSYAGINIQNFKKDFYDSILLKISDFNYNSRLYLGFETKLLYRIPVGIRSLGCL